VEFYCVCKLSTIVGAVMMLLSFWCGECFGVGRGAHAGAGSVRNCGPRRGPTLAWVCPERLQTRELTHIEPGEMCEEEGVPKGML